MNLATAQHRRRLLIPLGVILCLAGLATYGFTSLTRDFQRAVQEAEGHYQAGRFTKALAAYQRIVERTQAPLMRMSAVGWRYFFCAECMHLQVANCKYRLAEAEMQRFQRASRDPRIKPRPSLVHVQRLLTAARDAYDGIPPTDPRTTAAARLNAARTEAWQLLLAAFDEQTSGRRAIRQHAAETIRRAADAVDFAHQHRAHLSEQERITGFLLLENLTAFSKVRTPPPRRASSARLRGQLGDLLLKNQAELSKSERKRFQQFFFALPFEANDPWPAGHRSGAGAGRAPAAH